MGGDLAGSFLVNVAAGLLATFIVAIVVRVLGCFSRSSVYKFYMDLSGWCIVSTDKCFLVFVVDVLVMFFLLYFYGFESGLVASFVALVLFNMFILQYFVVFRWMLRERVAYYAYRLIRGRASYYWFLVKLDINDISMIEQRVPAGTTVGEIVRRVWRVLEDVVSGLDDVVRWVFVSQPGGDEGFLIVGLKKRESIYVLLSEFSRRVYGLGRRVFYIDFSLSVSGGVLEWGLEGAPRSWTDVKPKVVKVDHLVYSSKLHRARRVVRGGGFGLNCYYFVFSGSVLFGGGLSGDRGLCCFVVSPEGRVSADCSGVDVEVFGFF